MTASNQTPYAGLNSTGAIYLVRTTSMLSLYGMNPNGVVPGQSGDPQNAPDTVWDYVNKILYVCISGGEASSAIWSPVFMGNNTTTNSQITAYLNSLPRSTNPLGDGLAVGSYYWNGGVFSQVLA